MAPPALIHMAPHAHLALAQHEPRLEQVERRGRGRSHATSHRPAHGSPGRRQRAVGAPQRLEVLVQRELDDRERDLAHDRGAPPAVETVQDALSRNVAEDVAQCLCRGAELHRLGPLLDHLGGDSHHARGDLSARRGAHVRHGGWGAVVYEAAFESVVGDEKQRRGRSRGHDGRPEPPIEAPEPAVLEEPAVRLDARLNGIDRKKRQVGGRSRSPAAHQRDGKVVH
ncbi:hypothetical protein KL909_003767 [Ogataea angusta]|nr:hypothetical protein KL909_003767 [Ogataea angusta]